MWNDLPDPAGCDCEDCNNAAGNFHNAVDLDLSDHEEEPEDVPNAADIAFIAPDEDGDDAMHRQYDEEHPIEGKELKMPDEDPVEDKKERKSSNPEEWEDMGDRVKFRFNARRVLLTYARADIDKDALLAFLQGKKDVVRAVIGKERHHLPGGATEWHVHAAITFSGKYDTRNVAAFDFDEHHPNIRCGGKEWDLAEEYAMKDDPDALLHNFDLFKNSKDFRKKKGDHDSWRAHRVSRTLAAPFPFTLPEFRGQTQEIVDPATLDNPRHVHWWIRGPPGCGKTKWAAMTFEGKRVFYRGSNNSYPFDDYNGEPVVIYDDIIPPLWELVQLSNIAAGHNVKAPGNHRYGVRLLPKDQRRVIIVLSNVWPTYRQDGRFNTRFHEWDLYDGQDDNLEAM